MKNTKTVIIGLDGVPFGMIKDFAETGVMPNTAELISQGIFKKMNLPIAVCQKSMRNNGISFADIDNDADFDFFVTSEEGSNYLYINQTTPEDSNWSFQQVDFSYSGKSSGSIIADFNNDGWQDIFVTAHGPNVLYLNKGNNVYTKLYAHPTTREKHSTAVAYADYDLDGDLDIFIANRDTLCLFYQNFSNDSSYIKFRVNGISSNRDAIGSRIEIYRTGYLDQKDYLLGTRQILAGGGYYSQNDPIVHFGLDTIRSVDAKIYFPSGITLVERELAAGQTYTVVEYSLVMRTIILSIKHLLNLMRQSVFWYQVLLALLFFALTFLLIRLGLKRYRWSSGTASGYLAGFFLMALIAIVALKKLGLLYIFATINILTVIFVTTFIINSERLYRLRKIRERYRSVLINLSNQIVNIHDDDQLCKTVVDNIHQITEFDAIAILSLHKNEKSFTAITSRGMNTNINALNAQPGFADFITAIKELKQMQKSIDKKYESYFNNVRSDAFIAIEHDSRLYGLLSIGAHEAVSPLKREDMDLFRTIANQMAIAMENNEYIRKSTEMIKKLTEAEVREKYMRELEATNAILDTKNRDLQKLYDELKNTQAQLIHSEKMASLGQLVAGISHELNNPIGFIYSNIKQLKSYTNRIESFIKEINVRKIEGGQLKGPKIKHEQIQKILPDIKNLIDDTISGSQMIKELVENLRRFSHLDQAKWKPFDIHEGLESSLKILLPQFKEQVEIHRNYKAEGLVECNPGQINQVFLNLLANAAQAIKNEGNIWIETYNDGDHIVIRIKDDGIGMSQEILGKIFDPFFTTKDVGEGTGLGLSISYSIIQNHRGTISAQSEVSKGSILTVHLLRYKKNT